MNLVDLLLQMQEVEQLVVAVVTVILVMEWDDLVHYLTC